MIANPIFIVGTERSGSNLLRLILNEHPDIAIPHPPHLFKELHPLLSSYGDLSRDSRFRHLIADAIRIVGLHFAPWEVNLDPVRIFEDALHRDLYCVYAGIHEQFMRHAGKKRWGCKSTFMIHHVDKILKHHAEPKLIHIVRDGRDVAVSAKKSVFNHYHPHYVARLWKAQQREGTRLQVSLSAERFLVVRYEDLIGAPEAQVRRICEFLEVEYSERMLRYFENPSSRRLAALSDSWRNVSRPILAANSGKFRTELTAEETFEFERIALDELLHFGYEPVNDPVALRRIVHPVTEKIRTTGYFLQEKFRMAKVELSALLRDENALLRVRKRLFVAMIRWRGRFGN